MVNLASPSCSSLQILGKTLAGVLPISEFLVNPFCHNSRTINDLDMKLGPVTKFDKWNKSASKNDDDTMSANCDVIVIFQIYGQFGVIQKPDSRCIVCKNCILLNSNPLYYKNWKQSNKNSNTDLRLLPWVKVLFL